MLGDPESIELSKWRYDVNMASSIFRGVLVDNPLAARCAEILDHILPLSEPQASGDFHFDQLDASNVDMAMWPVDLANMFGSFGWPDAGQNDVL